MAAAFEIELAALLIEVLALLIDALALLVLDKAAALELELQAVVITRLYVPLTTSPSSDAVYTLEYLPSGITPLTGRTNVPSGLTGTLLNV
jgi:hypothetical protein